MRPTHLGLPILTDARWGALRDLMLAHLGAAMPGYLQSDVHPGCARYFPGWAGERPRVVLKALRAGGFAVRRMRCGTYLVGDGQ